MLEVVVVVVAAAVVVVVPALAVALVLVRLLLLLLLLLLVIIVGIVPLQEGKTSVAKEPLPLFCTRKRVWGSGSRFKRCLD